MTNLRELAALSLLAVCLSGAAAPTMANDLLPHGTLRAAFIGTNPVQAVTHAQTGEVTGPAADIARALAARLNVPAVIAGAPGVPGVLAAVKSGAADIGFLAFDEVRAAEVDFSQTYALAQNTYLVRKDSPIQAVADVDKAGIRIGVAARDAGDFFLTRTVKHAELVRFEAGNLTSGLEALAYGRIDAFAANRQRLSVAARDAVFRMLPDNFYGVEQSVIVQKGNTKLLEAVNRYLSEARESEFIAGSLKRSGIVGLDVAPAMPGLVNNVPRAK
ncbi:MAG: amino acid transporter substrate-binding protein [Xanthobacteraceae bacterium]|nr:amino acid transporter substrate-binding protein [Xanthobacteraceae bacterium]